MSASGGFSASVQKESDVPIARLIAEPASLSANCDAAIRALEGQGIAVRSAEPLAAAQDALEFRLEGGEGEAIRALLDRHFPGADLLVSLEAPTVPGLFISDMDSTMIAAECIDELADFAGIKAEIAAITERAMQGELDFAEALRERVRLLGGLAEDAIGQCLAERIAPMPGARVLVETLKAQGCHTVLVTGGFHQFADPVADWLGFEQVVANRLAVVNGKLSGGLVGDIVDSAVKQRTLREQAALRGGPSLATGDGANDIPMLAAADYGIAYHAKPKARAAAHGWIDRGDLTSVLALLGVPRGEWVWD
jgi:phosphoserine phosphatase